MRWKAQRILCVMAVGVMLATSGCYFTRSYQGNGQLTYLGFQLKSAKYVLDLGPVDLSKIGKHTFRLGNLPATEFTVAIAIDEGMKEWGAHTQPNYSTVMSMRMLASGGEVVIDEQAPLKNWDRVFTGSVPYSLFVRRGKYNEIPIGGGSVELKKTGLKTLDGWGSYFVAINRAKYTLHVETIDATERLTKQARVVLLGL